MVFLVAGALWLFGVLVKGGVKTAMRLQVSKIEAKEKSERAATDEHKAEALAELALKEVELGRRRAELVEMRAAFNLDYVRGRQWLAQFIAEAREAPETALAVILETKKHPASVKADHVRRLAAEKKELTKKVKLLEYSLKTIYEYYPAVEQYADDILNEQATLDLTADDEGSDPVSKYISQEEYERLSPSQRNQLAFDNWLARGKTSVDIGRMYERYLGHLYENDGWSVTFTGATQGLEDMGRDLICVRGVEIHVVQAKYWAKHRTVYERHILQLYGTTVLLPHSYPNLGGYVITPIFATTTKLSETAVWAAERLKVHVRELPMKFDYPMIKCNVNASTKIYHLPFDQQYDRVKIDATKGESYALTVAEAEKRGFRRAMRHWNAA